ARVRVTALHEVVQHVHVLTGIPARIAHEAIAAVVAVVRVVGCHGNDGLEAFHASGGGGDGQRAVVRGAGHAHLAGGPRGLHFVGAIDGGESPRAAVQPVDDGLGGECLIAATHGNAALTEARAR